MKHSMAHAGTHAAPWFKFDAAWWPQIAQALVDAGAVWPLEAATADLRWFSDQLKMGRVKRIPSSRDMASRWGWSRYQARTLMADEARWAVDGHVSPTSRPSVAHFSPTFETKEQVATDGVAHSSPTSRPLLATREFNTDLQTTEEQITHTPVDPTPETAPDLSPSGGTPDGVVCESPVENPVDNLAAQEDTAAEEITPSSEAPAPSHTSSDTPQQTLIPADHSAAAAPPPAADPVDALWQSLEAIRLEVDPKAKGWKLTPKRRTALSARLREHTPDEIRQVWRWWLTSTSPRAVYLREQGYTDETILRPAKFPGYLALSQQAPTIPAAEAWDSVVDALAYWKHIPPWISWAGSDPWAFEGDDNEAIRARYEAGIMAAGGAEDIGTAWRNLYRLASNYDRNQQRRAFLGAWSRSSLREVA